jgi:ubiquinone/menaquinone biosynthesis C-methylase UbiE
VHFDSGRDFATWALALVPIGPNDRILDAGCGWGRFTWVLADEGRARPGDLVGVDCSAGMIATAREEARRRQAGVCFGVADVEALPFTSGTFALAIAAHMLYDVPNLERGIREFARVLRPDGCLLATTNSEAINPLVLDLHDRALRALGIAGEPEEPSHFSLENGAAALRAAFARVTTHVFEDTTTWPDPDTFVADYVTLGRYRAVVEDRRITRARRECLADEVRTQAMRVMEREGRLQSPVLMGAFVGSGIRDGD